jgi:hypothetical protein
VANEVTAEAASSLLDALVRRQLDEIRRLVLVEVVVLDQAELHRRSDHALLEILGVEGKAVAEKLDDIVVPGLVVHLARHCF